MTAPINTHPALELFIGAARPETSALRAANDSEMAPQAVEIAQNGLGQIRQLGVAGKENRSIPHSARKERSRRKAAKAAQKSS
jgi:hypothetical protein